MEIITKLLKSGIIQQLNEALYGENEEECIMKFVECRKKMRKELGLD